MKPKRITQETPLEVLQSIWGFSAFRPMQLPVIESILEGKDTLALMPTGGGKSITFQVPAMMCAGVTLVISPLVALMKDQVDQLREQKIKAGYIHAGLSRGETLNILENCTFGSIKLLYVSPERLTNSLFLRYLPSLDISFVVIDEAHCISQWGYDFRPDYLKIIEFRKLLPELPFLALTATATPYVVQDIMLNLGFAPDATIIKRSFYRKNLSYVVRKTYDKAAEIVHILSRVPGSALIYVRSRKKTAQIANFLTEAGFSADFFHAGLPQEIKSKKQNAWQAGEIRIMVCTNAFGMGINKEDVSLVIHPTPPPSPEYYYQEAGRAGRNNKGAYAVLLYTPNEDERYIESMLEREFPPRNDVKTIYDMLGNYFQLGIESGEGAIYEFDIYDFCKQFKVPSSLVTASLNLLRISEYIEYLENHNKPSLLKIVASRNDLYSLFSETERIYDDVIEHLLRNYPGLFSEYAVIEESSICRALGLSPNSLALILSNLRAWHVIDYIPGKRSNFIYYIQQRVPSKRLRLRSDIYTTKYHAAHKRVESMIEYMQCEDSCRAQILMKYFGMPNPLPCGHCDYCLSHPSGELTYRKIDQLEEWLREHPTCSIEQISSALPHLSPKQLSEALQYLIDEGFSIETSDDQVHYYQ